MHLMQTITKSNPVGRFTVAEWLNMSPFSHNYDSKSVIGMGMTVICTVQKSLHVMTSRKYQTQRKGEAKMAKFWGLWMQSCLLSQRALERIIAQDPGYKRNSFS